jgi:hypothetical protein
VCLLQSVWGVQLELEEGLARMLDILEMAEVAAEGTPTTALLRTASALEEVRHAPLHTMYSLLHRGCAPGL